MTIGIIIWTRFARPNYSKSDSNHINFEVKRLNRDTLLLYGFFCTVPLIVISSAGQTTSAYTITLKLPEISYSRSELIIISTLTPTDSAPITDDYPLSSQYSVTFNGLSVGVVYSYSIRIVLRTNTSIDVSIPVTGSFTICKHRCA